MGHQALVYGRIQEDWEGTGSRWPIAPEYNRAVLEGLPDSDDQWPFLTRHMFAVAARPICGANHRGWYRGYVIHFAASLKDDPEDPGWPDRFLDKLEGLVLRRMLWLSAKVHFESVFFSERVFLYEVDRESLGGLYDELGSVRFGERVEGEVRWARRELQEIGCRPTWLL
uniref:Uncharacterized protein n=1 Tax=Schlesneria paludicola TaxID=360056 RepID=A0A7C4QNP6_9PLAN